MPVVENGNQASLEEVCHKIEELGPSDSDYDYIRSVLQDIAAAKILNSASAEVDASHLPVADKNASGAVEELVALLGKRSDGTANELISMLTEDDLQSVLHAHDDIANRVDGEAAIPEEPVKRADLRGRPLQQEPAPRQVKESTPQPRQEQPAAGSPSPRQPARQLRNGALDERDDACRVVSVRRRTDEPLGITVNNDSGDLIVVRILPNSVTHKQGLLHVGDLVKEVNNVPVTTPEQLTDLIRAGGNNITFKIIPGAPEKFTSNQLFLKAHFKYDPLKDKQIASRDLGLSFADGDILHITKREDKMWWEATNVTSNRSGLIPSPAMEEKRKSMPAPQPMPMEDDEAPKSSLLCGMGRKKKRSFNVTAAPAAMSALAADMPAVLYEEVKYVAPVHRRTLVLAGAQGLGRRSLKNKIIASYPSEFGTALPSTSRAIREGEVDGRTYHFKSRADMERDIKNGRYLEYGELKGNYYGTGFFSLTDVINLGRVCVIDAKATVLAKLRTAEWTPFIVFLNPPSSASILAMNEQAIASGVDVPKKTEADTQRIYEESGKILRGYKHLFDALIRYDDFDQSFKKILNLFEDAKHEQQWVPASWANSPDVTVLELGNEM